MITRWKLSNFKSIRNETDLDLGRLTVFAGANSSGKSTFIQSILLVTQTLNDRYRSQPVVLNGPFVKLGRFDDIKSDGENLNQISIGWTCAPFPPSPALIGPKRRNYREGFYGSSSERLQEVSCEISFDAGDPTSSVDLLQHRPHLVSTQFSGKFSDDQNLKEYEMLITRSLDRDAKVKKLVGGYEVLNDWGKASLSYDIKTNESIIDEMKHRHYSGHPVGCSLSHFFPEQYVMDVDIVDEVARGIINVLRNGSNAKLVPISADNFFETYADSITDLLREILSNFDLVSEKIAHFDSFDSDPFAWGSVIDSLSEDQQRQVRADLDACDDLLQRVRSVVEDRIPDDWNNASLRPGTQPQIVYDTVSYLYYYFLNSVKYIGPLRRSPKFSYPLPVTSDLHGVGTRGEGTAFILDVDGKTNIEYIPSKNFKGKEIEKRPKTQELATAIIDWLRYLGICDSVKSNIQGTLGHELKIIFRNRSQDKNDKDQSHNIVHTGVGVSQVLPIVATGLLSKEDSTIIFEQPELHLHPNVQSLLADFFLSLTLCNRQCIVETHSEHLVNRLRYRIAAASNGDELCNLTKVFFTKMGPKGSVFDLVPINEYGAISDWPEGFFDQSYKGAQEILNAALEKRKFRKMNEDG